MVGTTTRVRSFNVVQLGLMYGIICAVIGVVIGLLLGLFSGALASVPGGYFPNIGFLGIVLFPIIYGIGGFIAGFIEGLIIGALYNLVAAWIGGVEVQLEARV
jgi:hypothetical protein